MHFKLFEEFNPYTGRELADKMRLLAVASPGAKSVSPVVQRKKDFVFDIVSKTPSDYRSFGTKVYKVFVPFSQIEKARVITFEGEGTDLKEVFHTDIEIKGENDLEVIMDNYIEATGLYDDNDVEQIVDNIKNLETVEDIKKLMKTLI